MMNHAPLKGDNFKDADKYNQQFCRSVLKEAKPDIIAEWETIKSKDFVAIVKDLLEEDKELIHSIIHQLHLSKLMSMSIIS